MITLPLTRIKDSSATWRYAAFVTIPVHDPKAPPAMAANQKLHETEDPYRPLRIGRRILVAVLSGFCILYYPVLDLVVSSLIPVVALFILGAGIGFVGRRKTLVLYGIASWLVVAAVVLRRVATAQYSPHLFMFDGALAGYPLWSVWFAEVLRVGANLWSLWIGANSGRWVRFRLEAGIRRLVAR